MRTSSSLTRLKFLTWEGRSTPSTGQSTSGSQNLNLFCPSALFRLRMLPLGARKLRETTYSLLIDQDVPHDVQALEDYVFCCTILPAELIVAASDLP